MAEKAEIVLSAKDTTSPAFATAQRNFASLQSAGEGIALRLAGIGAAVAVAASALEHFNPKPVIDQADALGKLSQRTGIAVETLSAYQYAAKLADVSNEDLASGFKKLNLNIAAAARGETEQAEAFKAIGVSVTDASGKVRSADKVFEDIAERFAGYADGPKKVALANAVGGKSFEKFIPLLDDGKKGLIEAREELEKYGGVIGGDLAKKSQQFNDNLTRLSTASGVLKVEIAGGLIDSLLGLSERLVEASKNGGLLKATLLELSKIPTTSIGFANLFLPKQDEVAQLTTRAENLGKTIDKLREKVAADPGNLPLIARLKTMSDELDSVNRSLSAAVVSAADRAPKALRTAGDFQRSDKDRTSVGLPEAPPLPNKSAGDDASALLRKQLEGRLKALQDGLEREKDLVQFNESKLSELYSHGDISIDVYFDAKAKAGLDFLVTQSATFDKLIAEQRAYEAKAAKPQEKQDARNKITELEAQRAKALRESGQAAEVAEQQRVRAIEEFQRNLQTLDAQLAELSGDKYGAELLRNAQAFDDARKVLEKGGASTARAEEIKRLSDLQANLNKVQTETNQLLERAQIAEESLLLLAERGGLSRTQVEAKVHAQRQQALEDLDKQIEKQAALVALSKDPAELIKLEQLRLARERAFSVADPGLTRFNEQIRGTADTIASSIEDAIVDGSSAGFKQLEKNLVRMVINDQFTKPLSDALNKGLKDLGSGGTGGGFQTLVTGAFDKLSGLLGGGQAAKPGASSSPDVAGLAALESAAASGADSLDTATSSLVANADRASSAFGSLPGVLGQFATYIQALLTSSSTSSAVSTGSAGSWFAGLFGSGSSAGGSSAAGTVASDDALALFFHNGGVVGDGGGNVRMMDPSAWASPVRYHQGGIAGLAPDERPAVLRMGEEVLRADDPRHRDNGGMNGGGKPYIYSPTFVLSNPASKETQSQVAAAAFTGAQRAAGRNR